MDIIPFLLFIVIAATIALLTNRRIEVTFPFAAIVFIVILFFSGLTGNLLFGLYTIWFLSGLGVIYIFWQLIKNFSKTTSLLFRPGLVLFIFAFVIFLFWHRYDIVNTWDELAQWGLAVKNSFLTNEFANSPLSNKSYLDYPPAVELFHYFWTKTCGVFKDSSIFISMNVLILSFLIPALQTFSFKNLSKTVFAAVVIVVIPYALYPWIYTLLLVDPLLGIIFGWVLYTYYSNRTNFTNFSIASLSLGVFTLPLIKQSGIFFAIIALILIIIDQIILLPKSEKVRSLWKLLPLVIAPMASKLLWSFELSSLNIGKTWNYNNVINYVQTSLLPWQRDGFVNYYKALFNYNILENTSQTVYNLGPFQVSAIVWISIIFIFLTGIYLFLNNKKSKFFFIGLFVGAIIYVVTFSFIYLVSFGEGETSILSSFSRYLNSYFISILLFCVALLLIHFGNAPKIQAKKISIILFILLFLVNIPLNQTPFLWFDPNYSNAKIEEYNQRNIYKSYITQLLNYVPKNAVLHNFYGDIAGSRYLLCPIKVNSPLWQSSDFSWYRTFAKQLVYTHVFFGGIYGSVETEEFKNNFGDLFLPGSQIKDYSLYEVVWQNDIPMMKFIVQLKPSK